MRKILRLLYGLCFVGFFAFMAYDFVVYRPEAKRAMKSLEAEASVIRPPVNATEVGRSATHRERSALVTSSYRIEMSYPEIRSYYDAHLAEHGWTFAWEQPNRDWGRDLGGISAYYRKGEYVATIQFAGAKADYGWTYSLGFGWRTPTALWLQRQTAP